MQVSQKCNHFYFWAEDIFLNDEGIIICHNKWLVISVSLQALAISPKKLYTF